MAQFLEERGSVPAGALEGPETDYFERSSDGLIDLEVPEEYGLEEYDLDEEYPI